MLGLQCHAVNWSAFASNVDLFDNSSNTLIANVVSALKTNMGEHSTAAALAYRPGLMKIYDADVQECVGHSSQQRKVLKVEGQFGYGLLQVNQGFWIYLSTSIVFFNKGDMKLPEHKLTWNAEEGEEEDRLTLSFLVISQGRTTARRTLTSKTRNGCVRETWFRRTSTAWVPASLSSTALASSSSDCCTTGENWKEIKDESSLYWYFGNLVFLSVLIFIASPQVRTGKP